MKILFLSELFYPHAGGAELATYLYAKLLSHDGNKVVVVTNLFKNEKIVEVTEGFTIHRLPLLKESASSKFQVMLRFDVLFSKLLRKLILWSDIVYIPRYWFSAIPVIKSLGRPVVTHLHDYIPICPLAVFYQEYKKSVCEYNFGCSGSCIYSFERRKRNIKNSILSLVLNRFSKIYLQNYIGQSNRIICVSKTQKNIIKDHSKISESKFSVVYNPLPPIIEKPLEGNDFGYFGGLNYRKGVYLLYHALKYGRYKGDNSINVHATKFGGVNEHLLSLFKGSGFLTYDKLNTVEFNDLYRKIKGVIIPSVWNEPLPYVVAEAILQKRVLIVSSMGGIPEQVKNCKGVFMFNPNDDGFKGLYSNIKYVNDLDRENVIDLGVQNRDAFLKRFSNEKALIDFSKVLLEAIK